MRGLALIRDADGDTRAAATAIDQIFEKHFNVKIPPGETLISDGRKLGAFIFPGNEEPGDLEKACLSTVHGTPLEELAENFMQKAQAQTAPLNQPHKRKAQVYLTAASTNLCRGVGYGFKDGLFNSNHAAIDRIREFLKAFLVELIEQKAA